MKEVKQYDWKRLAEDLMELLFLNQKTLAKRLEVTQQSISHWTSGKRNPNVTVKRKIIDLARREMIDLTKYEKYTTNARLLEKFEKLSNTEKAEVMDLIAGYIKNKMKKT